jgi:two-component system NtrC family sensor kinase
LTIFGEQFYNSQRGSPHEIFSPGLHSSGLALAPERAMSAKQPTILVVDDEVENCDLYSAVLTSEGNYRVECAYNGQQALDMVQANRYDLIISDITMPKLDGLSFLREIKKQQSDVEVIMISGVGTVDSAVDAFKSQAFDFLTKPLEIDRLLTTVKNALSKSSITTLVNTLASTLPYAEMGDQDLLLGHLLVSEDGTILSMSQRLVESLGIRLSSPQGTNIMNLPQVGFLTLTVALSLEEKTDYPRQWAVLGLKEHLRVLAYSTAYLAELPTGTGALTVVQDTTRIRRQERERRDRERLSAIGGMTAVVAQQVTGLLGTIMGKNQMVLADVQSLNTRRPNISTLISATEQSCGTMNSACDKIASLLSTLQDFSRQFVPQYATIDVNELVEKAANQIEEFPDGVEISFDLADNLSPVMGNAKDLTQVLTHLLQNAIQAVHGKGTVTITSRSTTSELASIEVADNGEGISVENLDRIFEPFFTTRGDRGKGLGLALARKVIDDHDGVINVVSQPGKGSTFTITLPVNAS